MLAPSGGGLILYQAYGNLYAMIEFGGNTRDLAHLEKKRTRLQLYTNISRISTQKLETASQITRDAVTTHLKTASQDLQTASDCIRGTVAIQVDWYEVSRSTRGSISLVDPAGDRYAV
ncbi:hypothetical protein Tco_0876580 [Tanacetum coccineum]|uniref:Uncharacterized protein n=1 Tax=Tanacetum coccineum TaxID=301880 RepID=A0ABQ5BYG2_9ASTR